MLLSTANDVKIYNLSAGKTLPEWLTDRKRRKLEQKDVEVRRRVELIQDFEMPDVSHAVTLSHDGNYIFVAGTYKPRVRCYDVHELSMKFERCLDSEVIKMLMLSDDYEKIVFLEEDRFVEFHVRQGRYHRTRIPRFGRDLVYHSPSCELYIAASGPEVYRLNLEQGRFMSPLTTDASSLLCCAINEHHHLFLGGTWEGKVEAWDPRSRQRAGMLDCAKNVIATQTDPNVGMPTVSAIKCRDALHVAVGTSSGQVLLYDLRSRNPLLVKDHLNGLAIKSVEFSLQNDLVVSMDERMIKIWRQNEQTTPYCAIEPGMALNNLCFVPNTGLMFVANEERKVQTFYVPSLGAAPKWCSFLDNVTDELEQADQTASVFDDYRFVTKKELDQIGLAHLIGTNLLRAYMHGYFVDARLYAKAQSLTQPFAFETYRKKKLREKIDQERERKSAAKSLVANLPKVNRELAQKLTLEKATAKVANSGRKKARAKNAGSLLSDSRFQSLFTNAEFEVDVDSEEFRLLNPALARLEKGKTRQNAENANEPSGGEEEEPDGGPSSGDEHSFVSSGSSESDDDKEEENVAAKQVEQKTAPKRKTPKVQTVDVSSDTVSRPRPIRMMEMDEFAATSASKLASHDLSRLSLADRMQFNMQQEEDEQEEEDDEIGPIKHLPGGGREMTFKLKKKSRKELSKAKEELHKKERRKEKRSATEITRTLPVPAFMKKKTGARRPRK